MKKRIHWLGWLWLILGACVQVSAAESLQADHVRVRWLAPEKFGAGSDVIGILFEPDPHWHVYWKNPGDSGAAPKFQFRSDSGAEVGPVLWPFPVRLPIAHLTNLGYEGAVAYPLNVTAQGSTLHIEAKLEWLVCKEECIPGFGTLVLKRPVTSAASSWSNREKELLQRSLYQVPGPEDRAPWKIGPVQLGPEGLQVRVIPLGEASGEPDLFPVEPEFISPASPRVQKTASGYDVTFDVSPAQEPPRSVGFVLVADGKSWEFPARPLEVSGPVAASPVAKTLWFLLLSAFVGGVLLNLMPCVFPVLSIKLLSLLKGESHMMGRLREGLHYSAGVLVTFAALGGAFLALRAAGASIGWGFQLQSPAVVLGLALVFWLLALNFLGVFEFGGSIMNVAGRTEGWTSSFGTGVLSVFVAAPCTGPFMGSALGASATLPAMEAMTIFLGLGAGLAAPFLALTASPSLLNRLPKPGPWMETLKQFFAFPLFATVLWLLWVLGAQTGSDGWLIAGGLLLAVSFALWLARSGRRLAKGLAWIIALSIGLFSLARVQSLPSGSALSEPSVWSPYDRERIEAARAEGQSVFVDFTAAWCITCQVNKKTVLETDEVRDLFSQNNVLAIRADWTKHDPAITNALAQFGRNSVPLYLFYPGDGSSPKILPQILTLSMIQQLFDKSMEVSR